MPVHLPVNTKILPKGGDRRATVWETSPFFLCLTRVARSVKSICLINLMVDPFERAVTSLTRTDEPHVAHIHGGLIL